VIIDELSKRRESDTVAQLVRYLRSNDPHVIGRAALALAGLGATTAVPKLIPALVQVERKAYVEPAGGGEAGGGASSYAFGDQLGSGAAGVGPSAFFGNTQAIGVLTGPVVGPGVVAYGGTSVPFYSGAALGGGGVGVMPVTGGVGAGPVGGGSAPPRPTLKVVNIVHPNQDVLDALEKLTGRNFGFNIDTWRRWVATDFRVEEKPSRRAPQPGKG
jgi:hypothetical protein